MSESNFDFSWFGDLLFCKVPLHRYPGKSNRGSSVIFFKTKKYGSYKVSIHLL